MKYIDADRLREAIDAQRQKMVYALYENTEGDEKGIRLKGMHDAFVDSLALIDKIQQEPLGSPLCGVVYNDSEHLPGLIVDSAQFHDRLKGFPDGAKVDIFIIAKEDK